MTIEGQILCKLDILTAQVRFLTACVYVLCALIVVITALKAMQFIKTRYMLKRVELLLTLAEKHGGLTDDRTQEIKTAAEGVAEVVRKTAASLELTVPTKTAEEVSKVVSPEAQKNIT